LDRSKWKTLRDFVDERAIEDALDNMDRDRSVLDVGYQGFVQNID
jgi:autophagy-related protein 17